MEHGTTTPLDSKLKTALLDNTGDTAQTERRLAALIAANAETDRRNKLYPTLAVEAEVVAMRRPLTPEDAFAYFGLMIGLLVPASMFIAFALASSGYTEWIVYTLTTLTTITTTVAGYLFGKVVGRSVDKIASRPGHIRFMLLLLIGALWGIAAGAMGGVFIFIIGAFFGAVLGGIVGSIALPAFALPYYAVRKGDMIDTRHFLPLAFGVTLAICSLVFGSFFR